MKYLIFLIFIKFSISQIVQKEEVNSKEEKIPKSEIKSLEIHYNKTNRTDIQLIEPEINSRDKKFVLSEQTYIIYPSNNMEIEQYSIILSTLIKNITGINIGVTPNMAMKMTNKIKNNFIQLILENKNNENIDDIVRININHRKILIKAKDLIGINQGINIIKQLLMGNNLNNNTFNEVNFGPIQIILSTNIKNDNKIYFGILISFILIVISFCFCTMRHI